MPGDRKYKIIAKRNGTNNYSFELENLNGGPANLTFNKTDDKLRKRDYYLLEFHLRNEPGCDLEFVDDRAKVLSACHEKDAVNGCAPEGSSYFPDLFVHPTLPLQKKLVHVVNTDQHVEKFYFGFSFVSKTYPAESPYFDPPGDNQDGGLSGFDWDLAVAGMVSGAVAAIATLSLAGNSLEPVNTLLYGAGGAVVGLVVGLVVSRF